MKEPKVTHIDLTAEKRDQFQRISDGIRKLMSDEGLLEIEQLALLGCELAWLERKTGLKLAGVAALAVPEGRVDHALRPGQA